MIYPIFDKLRFGWQLISGFRYKHEQEISYLRERDILPLINFKSSLDILDLANGQLRPQITLLKQQNHNVYGIDLVNHPKISNNNNGYQIARWIFNSQVQISKKQLSKIILLCGDAGKLPFANGSFDVITSVAAFEHFLEIPFVLEEASRVLRKGGIIWVLIHLFSSLSGGHNIKLMEIPLQTIPKGIDPWDHLRERKLPFHVPLNQWRMHQYYDEISQRFQIKKDYCALREGEHLLTPVIETDLEGYTRDELTCAAYVIVAEKN